MLLNRLAYDALEMPAAVKLLYDEDRRMIGLKPEDIRRVNNDGVMKLELGKTITIGKAEHRR